MTLKERLENLGYRFLLKYDEGIQYEFGLQKENIHTNNYIAKVFLLGKLIIEMKFLKHSPYDKWIGRQKKLHYPEWDSEKAEKHVLDKFFSEVSAKSIIAIDAWGVIVWPILGDIELQKEFVADLLSDELKLDSREMIQEENEKLLSFSLVNENLKAQLMKACENKAKVILVDRYGFETELLKKQLLKKGLPTAAVWMTKKKFIAWSEDPIRKKRITYISSKKDFSNCKVKREVFFENPCNLGQYYRSFPNYNPVLNSYNTILNLKFHLKTGKEKINYFYGMGYKYGGILVAGICQWLNTISEQKGIEKIIFLSRDCDIISKAYLKWFGEIDSEYIYVSRRAVSEAFFKEFPEEYAKNLFLPKMAYDEKSVTVRSVFEDLEIDFLLEQLVYAGIDKNQRLDFSIYQQLVDLIKDNYNVLVSHFENRRKAALNYLSEKIPTDKKICVLDLGWKGTTINYLRYFQKMSQCEVPLQGALVAAMENTQVANKISRGEILTYLFANERVQSLKRKKGVPYNNLQVKCIESLFTSSDNTLTNYYLDEEQKVRLRFRDINTNAENIVQMQAGILDFLEDFLPFIKAYDLHISVEDAFSPLSTFLDNRSLVETFIHNLN